MAGASGNVVNEMVVKLSTAVDNQGMSNLFRLLDINKLKAMGLTAAFGALSYALVNFVKSCASTELEIAKVSREQQKNIETTRAEQTALKALGKSMDEVNKDPALKEIYDKLVKVNGEMALPDTQNMLDTIGNIRGAFYELKVTIQYASQWIAYHVFANLEEPINRLLDKVHEFTKWVRDNLNYISSKIGSYITAFGKGIFGIIEGVGKIIDFVNKLDPGIKRLGGAVLAVWAIIKAGPLGQILAMVTAIGGLIDDLDNWRWNKSHELEIAKGELEAVAVAFPGLWEVLFPEGGRPAQIKDALNMVFTFLTEKLNGFIADLTGIDLAKAFEDPAGTIGSMIDQARDWLENGGGDEKLKELGATLWKALKTLITETGDIGGDLAEMVLEMVSGDDEAIRDKVKDNAVVDGIISGLITGLTTGNKWIGLGGGIMSMIENAKKDLLASGKFDSEKDPGFEAELVKSLFGDLTGLGEIAWDAIEGAILSVNRAGGGILGEILTQMLQGGLSEADQETLAGLLGNTKDPNSILGGIATAFGAAIAGANPFMSLLAGLGSTVVTALDEVNNDQSVKDGEKNVIDGLFAELQTQADSLAKGLRLVLFDREEEGEVKEGLWTKIKNLLGAFRDIGKDIWENTILPVLETVWGHIKGWWDTNVQPQIDKWLTQMATKLYDLIPGWLRDMLGVKDPNRIMSAEVDKETNRITTTDARGNVVETNIVNNTGTQAGNKDIATLLTENPEYAVDDETKHIMIKSMREFWAEAMLDAQNSFSETEMGRQGAFWFLPTESFSLDPGRHDLETLLSDAANTPELLTDILNALSAAKGEYSEYGLNEDGTVSERGHQILESLAVTLQGFRDELDKRVQNPDDLATYRMWKNAAGSVTGELEQGALKTLENNSAKIGLDRSEWDADTEYAWTVLQNYFTENPIQPTVDEKELQAQVNDAAETAERNAPKIKVDIVGDDSKLKKTMSEYDAGSAGGSDSADSGEVEAAKSMGGRLGSAQHVLAGEDGTEYIIPITKTERAISLIKQMLNEMGGSVLQRILGDFGMGGSDTGTYGASLAGANSIAEAIAQGTTINNNYNISAPCNITVTSTGVSAADIGQRAYDAVQRHLLRTIRGVFA